MVAVESVNLHVIVRSYFSQDIHDNRGKDGDDKQYAEEEGLYHFEVCIMHGLLST
jgi:hypothetical protein